MFGARFDYHWRLLVFTGQPLNAPSKSFVASGFNPSNIATVILHACPGIFLKYYEE